MFETDTGELPQEIKSILEVELVGLIEVTDDETKVIFGEWKGGKLFRNSTSLICTSAYEYSEIKKLNLPEILSFTSQEYNMELYSFRFVKNRKLLDLFTPQDTQGEPV